MAELTTEQRFANMLKNAKAINKKIDDNFKPGFMRDYEPQYTNPDMLQEEKIAQAFQMGAIPMAQPTASSTSQLEIGSYTPSDVSRSKLPDTIKRAMMENPIELPSAASLMGGSIDVDMGNVKRLMGEGEEDRAIPSMYKGKSVVQRPQKQVMQEQQYAQPQYYVQPQQYVLTEADIQNIVDKRVIEIMSEYFLKALAEDTRERVLKQLAESGKISIRKKVLK